MKLYVRVIHEKSMLKEIERLQKSEKYKYVRFNLDEFTEIEAYVSVSNLQIFFKIPHEYGYHLLVIVPEEPFNNDINIRELFEQVFNMLPPNPYYCDEADEFSKQFWEGEKEIEIEV